jgi:hypothetical protein
VRGGVLTMRFLFVLTLLVIATGLTLAFVIGALAQ